MAIVRRAVISGPEAIRGQGRENAKEYLRQNLDLMNEIDAVIRQKALSGEIALPLEIGSDDSGGASDEE